MLNEFIRTPNEPKNVPFAGRSNNVSIRCNGAEMLVTTDVGPRVIFFGKVDGPNMFFVNVADEGIPRDRQFHGYGGHRLWIAPEETRRTLQPDNSRVETFEEDGFHVFRAPVDSYHIRKEIRIRPEPELDRFVLVHRLYNSSPYPAELAAWVLTQLPSGEVLFPQPPFIPHEENVDAARPLVMWHYTRLGDPRWTWGDRVVRLRHDPNLGPQKIGTAVQQGYAAAAVEGSVLFKRFAFDPQATYTDFGCNFETFARQDILEIETLSPFVKVAPGEYVEHRESWYLLPDETPPAKDDECAKWLASLAAIRPL